MRRERLRSRRRVLTGAAALGATAFAGCMGVGGSSTATPPAESVFESIAFEGQHLAIQLREDHDVSMINVIDPEGSLFAQQRVAVGETRVLIEMLDLNQGLGGSDHYSSGKYAINAITDSGNESVQLEISPELQVTNIEQYTGGGNSQDLAKVVVTVQNSGNAPTWVFDFTFRDAPHADENTELKDDPGIPWLEKPTSTSEILLMPGESQDYVGTSDPLRFREDNGSSCTETGEFDLIVGIADGSTVTQTVRYSTGGEKIQFTLFREYVCTQVEFELIGEQQIAGQMPQIRGLGL